MNSSMLGQTIRNRRRGLSLDQQALAELAQVSVHALSDIESGKGNPTFAVLNRLAAVLGLEISVRVRRAPEPEVGAAP
jgi:transcriptional regulator with XRE-family HTH domain